ncbi:MAG: histidinol-phosphate transaminase [Bacteroidota bacterium]
MKNNINRRNWLKSSLALAAGASLAPMAMASEDRIRPLYKPQVWERNFSFPPDLSNLKARLLANENPYGPSDEVRLAIMESVSLGNRYGHGDAQKLKELLAAKEGVSSEYIMLAPGSTDILEKTAISLFVNGGNIISADPSYMSLVKTAMSFGADWKNIPLTPDYAHDLPAMAAAIDSETKLIYVCNPNNPMGSLTPSDELRDFCSSVADEVPVFVDEAYLEFLEDGEKKSMADLVTKGKNLIVARTFSKIHGMAGLRIGYAVALPETLKKIREMVRSNMGLSVTSLRGAMASLNAIEFQEKSRVLTAASRSYLASELESLGFAYVPSHTSFMIFPIEVEGETFLKKMYNQGIGIRVFEIQDKSWCRVSMGTMDEMKMFVSALRNVVG